MTIPRILHIVWVGPHRPPTEMIESWKKKHEVNWFFNLATDPTGYENQEQIDFLYKRRIYNGVADIMRYELLHKAGGFALDADSECLKPLDEGDFLEQDTAVACYENELVRPGFIGCGFLGAPAKHPFFRACIDDVRTQNMSGQAWETVGPGLMGRVAQKMPDQIKVYPAKMFNPKHFSGAEAPGDHPIFASQGWGSTKGYNQLRKLACVCPECRTTMLPGGAPWM